MVRLAPLAYIVGMPLAIMTTIALFSSRCHNIQGYCVTENEQRVEINIPTNNIATSLMLVDEGKDGDIDYKEREMVARIPAGGHATTRAEPTQEERDLGNRILKEFYSTR
jgi:hypothetical protein